ncbi:MAG: type II toxin-antitoxin system death-on-curing family toxin [Gammaproteobacteria bacterium]|nr:type II toxin-antitoxin system death-on-curing family toxin [Gammaproteobacteria bacterium]MDE1887706.1 type II toxin-antitoxin system death-on-curing family toxin [Gammaproteobacteria bacterium]MDE2024107.1 type II toxin-antitoxin system death-on-curing family toxin [Gammaproteobacteria bacterium]MDE2139007.1 type II toxin-antitoxin system death-on-curing family toxin [Gammaproteobacteria bacterium]
MIVWLEKTLVLAMHDRQLAEHGGSAGVRDETLLESALARPQQLFTYGDPAPDLASLAASLAFGLARNHPFVDGNKRTAAAACETFLELNQTTLQADDLELYPLYFALAEGKLSEKDFAAWLRAHIQSNTRNQVHEPRSAYKAKQAARNSRHKKTQRTHRNR